MDCFYYPLPKLFITIFRQNLVSNKFDKNCKVIEFIHPEVLGDQLGGLEIGVEGTSETRVKEIVEKVVKYSAKTCSPYFYNQVLN